ncbi:MAG: heme ABC exporter ATP-binding protein CcmA [Firmicutes bacterium]|nr:heme ABC exporter ATP-binding protein CcmA [Bacillota bacterium]
MADLLEIQNLTKKIGFKNILLDVSFAAQSGDFLVVTGPNGAGKTTLLRLIAGLIKRTSGKILWNGSDYGLAHGSLGYISHKSMLYENLSVLENMVFFGRLYEKYSQKRIEELLKRVDLWLYRHEPAGVLSRGMQQRLALARTLAQEPKLVLYDEPFTGLDLDGQKLLRNILAAKRQRSIQILVTHDLNLLSGLEYGNIRLQRGRVVQERG